MYGLHCNQDCQHCENGECGLRSCTSSCNAGYYQHISGENTYCNPCPVNCQQCQNFTYCTLCDTGYYIYKYKYPTESKLKTAICAACENKSICDVCSTLSNCSQCSLTDGQVSCEHCVKGYTLYKDQCVKNIPCSQYCLTDCTLNGECNGCVDGTTGSRCTYRCYNRCATCLQTNQNVCLSCTNGFFSNTCNVPCPPNCAAGQCDFNEGRCQNGCLSGFWGDKCERNCSDHCTQSKCYRDGTCSHGCTAAYDGLNCNITTTTTKITTLTSSLKLELGVFTVNNCQEGSSISGPVLGGAVTGDVLITAFLVGSIAYFLHRRFSLTKTNNELREDTMYYNTYSRTTTNDETGDRSNILASDITTDQPPETSPYEQLSATNTEHAYSGL